MKASELRLGNWVIELGDGVQHPNETKVIVTDLSINGDCEYCNGARLNDFFIPIPLTEEWLLKLGFEIRTTYKRCRKYRKDNIHIDYSIKYGSFFCASMSYGYELKYVHQLQNLYFALTGNELEIK